MWSTGDKIESLPLTCLILKFMISKCLYAIKEKEVRAHFENTQNCWFLKTNFAHKCYPDFMFSEFHVKEFPKSVGTMIICTSLLSKRNVIYAF